MSNHTPGPWRIEQGRGIEAQLDGEWAQIAAMNRSQWSIPDEGKNARLAAMQPANARLIAAAPALYGALKFAVSVLNTAGIGGSVYAPVLQQARKALELAEKGEQG